MNLIDFPFQTKVAALSWGSLNPGRLLGRTARGVAGVVTGSGGAVRSGLHGVSTPLHEAGYVAPTATQVQEAGDAVRNPLLRGAAAIGRHRALAAGAGAVLGGVQQLNKGDDGSPIAGALGGAVIGGLGAQAMKNLGGMGFRPEVADHAAKLKNVMVARAHATDPAHIKLLDDEAKRLHGEIALYSRNSQGMLDRAQAHALVPKELIEQAKDRGVVTPNPLINAGAAGRATP